MDASRIITEEKVALSLQKEFGIRLAPDTIRLERRSWRWVAYLPSNLLAYIADTAEAAQRLAREHAVLNLLNDRVSFSTPVVEFSSSDDWLQVRRKIPGVQVGGGPEKRIGNSSIGPRLASDLGRAFAELHQAINLEECGALGIGRGGALPSPDELEGRLSGRLAERNVANALKSVLTHYRKLEIPPRDLVFTHGDPWGGNFAVNPKTGALNGLFDFDEMTTDDRNIDLRYLHSFGLEFKSRALTAYAQISGAAPSTNRISLYHLVSAFEALAHAFNLGDESMIARRQRWVRASIEELMDDLP